MLGEGPMASKNQLAETMDQDDGLNNSQNEHGPFIETFDHVLIASSQPPKIDGEIAVGAARAGYRPCRAQA